VALARYCFCVASTVGLMSRHTIGHERDAAIPYAARLGVALQLTKILRDTDEVFRIGRLNLLQDELARFRLGETSLSRPSVTKPGGELICFRLAGPADSTRTRGQNSDWYRRMGSLPSRPAQACTAGFWTRSSPTTSTCSLGGPMCPLLGEPGC